MNNLIDKYFLLLASIKDLAPLALRLILAYGFYEPAMQKVGNLSGTAEFFGEIGIPLPYLNAIMAAGTESLGLVLLFLGLGVRFITIPMMFVMIVAMYTVHWQHGFQCSKNGIEIPFYYFFMLFSLLMTGAGKYSLDHLIVKKLDK